MAITKIGKEEVKGAFEDPFLSYLFSNEGVNLKIKDSDVQNLMSKKYKLAPTVVHTGNEALENAFYAKRKELKDLKEESIIANFLDRIGIHSIKERRDNVVKPILSAVKDLDDDSDVVVLDGALKGYNPFILGHELGHAANNKEDSIIGKINRYRTGPADKVVSLGSLAAIGIGLAARKPFMAAAGFGANAASDIATVFEEREATNKAIGAMKELGQEDDMVVPGRALGTYKAVAGGSTVFALAQLIKALKK